MWGGAGGRGVRKLRKSVTYYLNGPLLHYYYASQNGKYMHKQSNFHLPRSRPTSPPGGNQRGVFVPWPNKVINFD